jgi:Trypsin-like peptidase domain
MRLSRSREDHLASAIVEIVSWPEENRIGTGAIVGPKGVVLTCHHNVFGHKAVKVRRNSLPSEEHVVESNAFSLSDKWDLALLNTNFEAGTDVLPLESPHERGEWFSRGFQDADLGFRDSVRLRGYFDRAGGRSYDLPSGTRYVLEEALDLRGDRISGGTSGAPLLNAKSEAIVGVIASALDDSLQWASVSGRGVAVPINAAAAAWPDLKKILLDNVQSVARFGPQPNFIGATQLCRAFGESLIEALRQEGIFDPSRSIEREGVKRLLGEFLGSDATVMPILGPAGTGKTYLLAHIVEQNLREPALLVRGHFINDSVETLSVLIDRLSKLSIVGRLRQWLPDDLEPPTAVGLAHACTEVGRALLVLIDGLNEAWVGPGMLSRWIQDSLRWCRDHQVKVVCTSQPHAWYSISTDLVERESWPMQSTDRGPNEGERPIKRGHGLEATERALTLGDFTEIERTRAVQAYGFSDSRDSEELSHPFFLRLAAEIPEARGSPLSLFEAALGRRLQRAAERLTTSPPTDMLKNLIRDLAQRMASYGRDYLLRSEVANVPLVPADAISALCVANILVELDQGFRFAYDQYADYLRSEFLDLGLSDDRIRENGELFAVHPPGWGVSMFAIERLRARLSSSRSYDIATYYGATNMWLGMEFISRILEVSLPARARCELLVEAGRYCYGNWRAKDWSDPQRAISFNENFTSDDNPFGPAVLTLAKAYPDEMSACLFERLSDTRLVLDDRKETKMSDLAGGCLARLATQNPEPFLRTLVRLPIGDPGRDLALWFARRMPERAVDASIDAVTELGIAALPSRKVFTLLAYATSKIDENRRATALSLLSDFLSVSVDNQEVISIGWLLRQLKPDDASVWDRLFSIWGTPSNPQPGTSKHRVTYSTLLPVPAERLATALDRIENDILVGPPQSWHFGSGDLHEETLRILGSHELMRSSPARVAALLQRAASAEDSHTTIALLLENFFYDVNDAEFDNILPFLELADQLLLTNSATCRRVLTYSATNTDVSLRVRSHLLETLRRIP